MRFSCGHSKKYHLKHGCDKINMPALVDDRTAMMLGLVPDKRTPTEQFDDMIDTLGASVKYQR